jgi:MFS transporter, FSR family, fosmidomycin resistance protein
MPPAATTEPIPVAVGASAAQAGTGMQYGVILAISVCHMINDVMQSLLAAIYPLLQVEFDLSYARIGLLSLAFMGTASVLQPLFGLAIDRRPMAQAMAFGMAATLAGLVLLALGPGYGWLLAGAALIGVGSAVFHPEASRVARAAAGGRFTTAQSLFQVGGNAGHAVGPLLAAFVVLPLGRIAVGAFAALALVGMAILAAVGRWHEAHRRAAAARHVPLRTGTRLSRNQLIMSLSVLMLLVVSKNAYTAALGSYYIFFLLDRFEVTTQGAQILLFLYLGASAVGVIVGGYLGDRFGTLSVIWFSILGCLPLTLLLPHVGLTATAVLAMAIGFVMASAFPAIVVYAQELVPGRVGMIAGLFFGLAFGIGGVAAALLGLLADARGIHFVFVLTAFLPALGLLTILLPRNLQDTY